MSIRGNDGQIFIDDVRVTQITSFTITETQAQLDANSMDSPDWDETLGGRKNWTASIEFRYDPDDTGQLLYTGVEGVGNFFPTGDTTGAQTRSGNIRVESVEHNQTDGEVVGGSATLRGTGALSEWSVVA